VRIRQFRAAGLVALATLVAAGAVLPIVGASAAAGGTAGSTARPPPSPAFRTSPTWNRSWSPATRSSGR
jgi:hypothetical protein